MGLLGGQGPGFKHYSMMIESNTCRATNTGAVGWPVVLWVRVRAIRVGARARVCTLGFGRFKGNVITPIEVNIHTTLSLSS